MKNKILLGDCRLRLREVPDNTIDSVVTDPPYELGYMAKEWDASGVAYNVSMWEEVLRVLKPGGHLLSFGGTRTYHRMACAVQDAGFEIRDQLQWIYGTGFPKNKDLGAGLGTALKPANEPIVLARKPISESTVTENVKRWGTGGLNIELSRLSGDRWPSNLLLDEQAAELLDAQEPGVSKFFYCAKPSRKEKDAGLEHREKRIVNDGRKTSIDNPYQRGDTERLNTHPTVKPVVLMEYLVNIITPVKGIVLDPFAGSGTTLIAAKNLGFDYLGIEMDPEFVDIAHSRIAHTDTGLSKFLRE